MGLSDSVHSDCDNEIQLMGLSLAAALHDSYVYMWFSANASDTNMKLRTVTSSSL